MFPVLVVLMLLFFSLHVFFIVRSPGKLHCFDVPDLRSPSCISRFLPHSEPQFPPSFTLSPFPHPSPSEPLVQPGSNCAHEGCCFCCEPPVPPSVHVSRPKPQSSQSTAGGLTRLALVCIDFFSFRGAQGPFEKSLVFLLFFLAPLLRSDRATNQTTFFIPSIPTLPATPPPSMPYCSGF